MSVNTNYNAGAVPGGAGLTNLAPQVAVGPAAGDMPAPLTPQRVLAAAHQEFPELGETRLAGKLRDLSSHSLANMDHAALSLKIQDEMSRKAVPISYRSSDMNMTLAVMPKKGVPGRNPAAYINEQVRAGEQLFNEIMAGTATTLPDKTDVAKLMWFLQALASTKAAESNGADTPMMFKDGAMSIEDPEGNLERFLMLANSYTRSSSHLKEFQDLPGCRPRGVDVRNIPTPNDRKTVLFARMPAEGAGDVQGMGKRMLFVKMEEHGCRGFSTAGTGRLDEMPSTLKKFMRFVANVKDLIGHGGGFAGTLLRKIGIMGAGQNNRERIPAELQEMYKETVKQCSNLQTIAPDSAITDEQRDILGKVSGSMVMALIEKGALGDTNGVRVMLPSLEQAKGIYMQLPAEFRSPPDFPNLEPLLDSGINMLRAHGDHADLRVGNEVILLQDEMKIDGEYVPLARNTGAPITGGLTDRSKRLTLADLSFRLADFDNDLWVDTFKSSIRNSRFVVDSFDWEKSLKTESHPYMTALDLRNAADSNSQFTKGLMAMCSLSLANGMLASVQTAASYQAQAGVTLKESYEQPPYTFNVNRLEGEEGGIYRFHIGVQFDGPVQVTKQYDDANIDPNQDAQLKFNTTIELACYPNGAMIPSFPADVDSTFTLNIPVAH